MLVPGGTSDFVCLCVFCVTLTPEDGPWRKAKIVQLFPGIPAHRRNTILGGLLWLAGTLVLCTNPPLESSNPLHWRGSWKGSKGNQPWSLWHCLQNWVGVMWICMWACFPRLFIAFNRFLQINLDRRKKIVDKDFYAKGSWLSLTRANLFVLFHVKHWMSILLVWTGESTRHGQAEKVLMTNQGLCPFVFLDTCQYRLINWPHIGEAMNVCSERILWRALFCFLCSIFSLI